MKKTLIVLSLVSIFSLMAATTALAKPGKGNPSGEVTAINEPGGTMTILTTDGEELTITLPTDFDYTTVEVGMTVTAKGSWTEDGFTAVWVKGSSEEGEAEEVEEEEEPADPEEGDTTGGEGNAWGEGGVYCAGGKEEAHPMAVKIAEIYGVSEEWVMEQVCDGHGFGSVMLALHTEGVSGEAATLLLASRKGGKGWGQLWNESGIVGSDHANIPPPGRLNKPIRGNSNGPPEGKGNGPPEDRGNGSKAPPGRSKS